MENDFANVFISNNTLTLNGLSTGILSNFQQAYGIRADESATNVSPSIKVVDNNVRWFSFGIRLGNTQYGQINTNFVYIPNSSATRRGIYIINSKDYTISDNKVFSNGYYPDHIGISTAWNITTSTSTGNSINCNQVWDGGRQYLIKDTEMLTSDGFAGNGMRQINGGADIGVVLDNSDIGTNGSILVPSDNHWETPFAQWCLRCIAPVIGTVFARPNVGVDVFDPSLASCMTGTGVSFPSASSSAPYFCMGVLMREGEGEPVDPSLMITYENAAAYISRLKNKSYQTIWDLQNAASIFSFNIIPDNDSLVTIYSEFPFAEEALLMENIKNLMSDSAYDQALELLQSHTWELEGFAYQAWMNILIITNPKDDEGNYDDATIETLTNIANLCPYVYGSAVLEARSKLQWGDSEESEECEAARLNPESYLKYGFAGTKNRQTKISLSPQPVAQGKEITLSAIGSDIAEVKLLSLQGTILWNTQLTYQSKSIKINQNSSRFSTRSLPTPD